jgi:hypothetical protein
MTIQTSTLRPGILVSLKSSLTGNVRYEKRVIESPTATDGGGEKAKWETVKTVADRRELARAVKARGEARAAIASVCNQTTFGLLCPDDREDDLVAAIREANRIVDEFNSKAKLGRVHVYALTGRIAPDDVEAVRAIKSEVRDLIDQMKKGVADLDVATIRKAAAKAKGIGAMLTPDAQARITMAIDAAREAARKIVKAGETAAIEVDRQTIARITEARTSFLDLEEAKPIQRAKSSGRGVDLVAGHDAAPTKKSKAKARQIDMGA